MNGTYGFVYSGSRGVGLGVLTIRDSVVTGCDTGGAKYSGRMIEDASGSFTLNFEMFVPAGTVLIQGASEQEMSYTKSNLSIPLRRNFDDGEPIRVFVPPGYLNLMVRQIPDEYAVYANGFDIRPVGSSSLGS
jgi:hypothetical protein